MQIILQESYMNLGEAGEVVNVKPGYARNFLIPQRIAVSATNANLKIYQDKAHKLEKKKLDVREKSQSIAKLLQDRTIEVKTRCSDEGKLYGSITAKDIQEEISKIGADLDKKQVILAKPIKMVGKSSVLVRLVGGIDLNLPLIVLSDNANHKFSTADYLEAEEQLSALEKKQAEERLAQLRKEEAAAKAEAEKKPEDTDAEVEA